MKMNKHLWSLFIEIYYGTNLFVKNIDNKKSIRKTDKNSVDATQITFNEA